MLLWDGIGWGGYPHIGWAEGHHQQNAGQEGGHLCIHQGGKDESGPWVKCVMPSFRASRSILLSVLSNHRMLKGRVLDGSYSSMSAAGCLHWDWDLLS
jgi:hypothetical protein